MRVNVFWGSVEMACVLIYSARGDEAADGGLVYKPTVNRSHIAEPESHPRQGLGTENPVG